MKKFDFKPVLALLAIIGFLAAGFALLSSPALPDSVKDVLLILVGALVAIVKDVYGYYFGSSEGSAKKTELLAPPVGTSAEQLTTPDAAAERKPGFGTQELS